MECEFDNREDPPHGLLRTESRRWGEILLQVASEGIHILDRAGNLIEMSDSFCRMLGYSREEMEGMHASRWDVQWPYAEKSKKLAGIYEGPKGEPRILETVHRRKDGRQIPVEISVIPIELGHDVYLSISARDITFRKTADTKIQRLSFNAMLARVNQTAAEAEDEPTLLRSLCEVAVQDGTLALAWIGRPDESGIFQVLGMAGATGYLEGVLISSNPNISEGQGPAGRSYREGRSIFDAHFETNPSQAPWKDRARTFGFCASAALPIRRSGTIWAILGVYRDQGEAFDAAVQLVLEELARTISQGLDRLDLLQQEGLLIERLETLISNLPDSVFLKNGEGRWEVVNPKGLELFDLGPDSPWKGKTDLELAELIPSFQETLRGCALSDQKAWECRTRSEAIETVTDSETGETRILSTIKVPLFTADDRRKHLVVIGHDITELKRAEENLIRLKDRMEFESLHDTLTGLPNRRALEHHLSRAIARAGRQGISLAVGMLDLDDFKPVNDFFGHEAGDRLLEELAKRLQSRLRENDFLARLGGDEFVIVIEDLDGAQIMRQLAPVLERLHQAVESPFKVVPGQTATVAMSMGLAVYPFDSESEDLLLRRADVAMYQIKERKNGRTVWWQWGSTRSPRPEQEIPFDVYGPEAALLLDKNRAHLEGVVDRFVEDFNSRLAQDPESAALLTHLNDEELQSLRARQAEHLRFLLEPSTTRAMILKRAEQVGQVHALVGAGGPLLFRSKALFSRLLIEYLNRVFLAARERYRIMLTIENRFDEDIQTQLRTESSVVRTYFEVLSLPLPQPGALWTDIRTGEFESLGDLPGIQAALLMRLNSRGVFTVENSAGPRGEEGADLLRTREFEAALAPDSPRQQSLLALSWKSLRIQTSPAYGRDPRFAHWHEGVRRLGIRSMVYVPVVDSAGHAVAMISLYGAYPAQFESPWMQQFARGLSQRWERIWSLCNAPIVALDEGLAMEYRKELFSGSLSMYMQPVVDLSNGQLVKVEALARLIRPDGEIVLPGVFLPLLDDVELDRLFRMGLEEALAALSQWDSEGLWIEVSLNLPPRTLCDPDCPHWVDEALKRHGFAPSRLTLELLENQSVAYPGQDEAIRRLGELGVKLAMDDLGSGYSSLERLSTLPFDKIKIDQNLLARIRTRPLETMSMVGAILQIGREFGRKVVVEGLEDTGMIEVVSHLGAAYGQGNGLAKPMPANQIPSWSRTFHQTTRSEEIRTFLGALAFHWQFMHSEAVHNPPPLSCSPLTRFFTERGFVESDPGRWLAELHGSSRDAQAISCQLIEWLVERVREEGVP